MSLLDDFLSGSAGQTGQAAPATAQPSPQAAQMPSGAALSPGAAPAGNDPLAAVLAQGQAKAAPQATPVVSNQGDVLPSYADGSAPDRPINKSPLSPTERLGLSVGNPAGQTAYLKQRFQDVQREKDGSFIVNDQGAWHRVSPTDFGEPDAWDATKKIIGSVLPTHVQMLLKAEGLNINNLSTEEKANLVGKLADNTGTAIKAGGMMAGGALGALGGAALLAPALAVPGAGVATDALAANIGRVAGATTGGTLASKLTNSLGRLAGTYQATPEQELKDVGWDGLLAAGGEIVGLGLKPALPMLRSALSTFTDGATNYAKDSMSTLWGTLTGAGKWAMRRTMDDSDSVMDKVAEGLGSVSSKVSPEEAANVASQRQAILVRALAGQGKSQLQANYASGVADLLKNVPDGFSANVGDIMKGLQTDMEKAGYGQFVGSGPTQRFKLYTADDVAHRLGVPGEQMPKIISDRTRDALSGLQDIIDQYGKIGTLQGKQGAAQLAELKRAWSESAGDLIGSDTPDSVKRTIYQLRDNLTNRVTQAYENAGQGLGAKYAQFNADYAGKKDAVDMLTDAVRNGTEDSVVKRLVSKAGSYRGLKDEAKSVADLVGPKGHDMVQDIADWEAAKPFFGFVPKDVGGNSAITTAKGAATLIGQTNPRIVAKQIAYASGMVNFLRDLPPSQLKSLLSNDQAIASFVAPVAKAYDGEDQSVQSLLSNLGVTAKNNLMGASQ